MTIAPETPAGPSRAFVLGHITVTSLSWGSGFLFIKLMNGEVSPWAIAAGRGCVAALALALFIVWLRQKPWPRRDEVRHWLILGTINGWLPNVLVAYALTQLASGPAAMIQAAAPLMTAVMANALFADERLTRGRLFGLLIGLLGVALLVGPRLLEGGGGALGGLAMLGVTIGYAVGNVYARAIPPAAADPHRLALGQQTVSGAVALLITLALAGPAALAPIASHWPSMLALGVLSTAIAITAFMRLILAAGPTRAAMTGYLVPTVAVILGILVLGETLEMRQFLGGGIILAGVWIVSTSRAGARGA